MPEVEWIKLTTDMFDDEKIRLIEAMSEGDAVLVIWTKLLCQAGKTNAGGYIYIAEDIPYTPEQLATLFNRKLSTVKMALTVFEKFHMIQWINGNIFLPNFEKHQNLEALQSIRESAKLRQQKHRLALHEAKRHVTVTGLSHDVTHEIENREGCHVTVTSENEIENREKPPKSPLQASGTETPSFSVTKLKDNDVLPSGRRVGFVKDIASGKISVANDFNRTQAIAELKAIGVVLNDSS